MFKIGEFSKLVRVSARMLRYYEKCGLLMPYKTDYITGYRLYHPKQIQLLNTITELRDMGFNVEEMKIFIEHNQDKKYIRKLIDEKISTIKFNICSENEKLKMLESKLLNIEEEGLNMEYSIQIKEIEAIQVLSLRDKVDSYRDEGMMWQKLIKFANENNVNMKYNSDIVGYSIYWDDEYKDQGVDIEISVPVETMGTNDNKFIFKKMEAIPLAATIRFTGPYENYSIAIEKLVSWVEENGYKITGNIRGASIKAPHNESNPNNYVTELQVPVVIYK